MLISILTVLLSWTSIGLNTPAAELEVIQPLIEVNQEVGGPLRIHPENVGIEITAQSAIALDEKTGQLLYKKNHQEVRPLASLTKLWTIAAALDSGVADDAIVTMLAADERNGSARRLYRGERLLVKDAIAATLVASDNSVAAALARATSGENELSTYLNLPSEKLGLLNTLIAEPSGLSAANTSTAEDVAAMARDMLTLPYIQDIASVSEYYFRVVGSGRSVRLENTNLLLSKDWPTIIAGKTGYTPEAGYNLAVLAENETGQKIVVVVMGSEQLTDRFQDTKNIIYWVFNNWQWKESGNLE
ncbi:MAG: D-alanyl-D-alanine carboxypeptidase [Candidatus Jacksonbacteria bacterium]|jgi:D-alanyl-D-alanine carboxypeptidase|nr:D-alanyl-D-alanine carboxypeptidase [Candidatus Jacksonbacteria bacterium]MBT6034028.1 D-alanyl-D-alanine carboxypeptidase [Candidatus Jacksonbacteria bacterium]MBT6301142.1 D-alanyl-D-alanine carboxypeptidase [Candidatus Jacksonbacteria bacterium]MBT6757654.1 D-alanyl-D-alanine carboxypeptidase [Candidatus Jacksonbacteria bacterium]MBT6954918.1 D-alanyl-D-alanine carboxypeptidase [Candidatus Jacksonbacteria bacterium]